MKRRDHARVRQALGVTAAIGFGAAQAQPAPSVNYTSFEATSAKATQIGYYATVNKDCSPAPAPNIRVVEPPKAGVFIVKPGELTTTRVKGCGAVKAPARILFYQARAGAAGADHFVYEIIDVSGSVGAYDVTITIKELPRVPTGADKPI